MADQTTGNGHWDLTGEEMAELPDLIDKLRSMVSYGEAITFPNGVTIDKRPLAYPTQFSTPVQPWNPGQGGHHWQGARQ